MIQFFIRTGAITVLFFLLIACDNGSTEDSTTTNTDSTETTVEEEIIEEDRGHFFSVDEQSTLRRYFAQGDIDALSDLMYQFRDAKTDVAMEKAWFAAIELQETMEESIDMKLEPYQVMKVLSPIDSVMEVMMSDCVAECTEFRFTFNLKTLKQMATQTKGDADDKFFDMMVQTIGDFGGRNGDWYKTFVRTWDYGGGVLAGNGLSYDFLSKSWEFLQNKQLFKKKIESVREGIIMDLSHPIYMKKKQAVLDELNKILEANILNTEEQKKVASIKEGVIAGKTKQATIQFGCENKDCDWGG